MRGTDELRRWASVEVPYKYGHQLTAIADFIDAEHEEAIQQALMGEGGVPATDENMAEHGWIRLPKDADGVPIRVGDVMDFTKNVRGLTVLGVGIVDASESSLGVFVREGDDYVWYNAEFLHHHAPTVEDVLREFALACEDAGNAGPEVARIATEYAGKLRLKEDA